MGSGVLAERHGWDVGDARVEVEYDPDHIEERVVSSPISLRAA